MVYPFTELMNSLHLKKSNFGSSHTTLWYANVLGCKNRPTKSLKTMAYIFCSCYCNLQAHPTGMIWSPLTAHFYVWHSWWKLFFFTALNFVGAWSEKAAAAADTEGSVVVNVTVIWEYGSKSKCSLFHTHWSEQSWNGLP